MTRTESSGDAGAARKTSARWWPADGQESQRRGSKCRPQIAPGSRRASANSPNNTKLASLGMTQYVVQPRSCYAFAFGDQCGDTAQVSSKCHSAARDARVTGDEAAHEERSQDRCA